MASSSSSSQHGQFIAKMVAVSTSSVLSILGSSAVLWMASRKLNKVYNRQIIVLSVADLIFSTSALLQPWLSTPESTLPSAMGTTASCTAVGFMGFHSSMSVALSNCTLSFYFLLRVAYGWQDKAIARRLEYPAYAIAIFGPLVLGIPAVVTKSINPEHIMKVCWIDASPKGCMDPENDLECIRGSFWSVNIIGNLSIFLVFCISMLCFCATYKVYRSVSDRIRASTNYSFRGVSNENMTRRLNDVSTQAILYSLVYFNTFAWPILMVIAYTVFLPHDIGGSNSSSNSHHQSPDIFWVEFLVALFYPIQGFLNFIVYSRLNLQRWRELCPDRSYLWAFGMVLQADPASTMTTSMMRRNSSIINQQGTTPSRPLHYDASSSSSTRGMRSTSRVSFLIPAVFSLPRCSVTSKAAKESIDDNYQERDRHDDNNNDDEECPDSFTQEDLSMPFSLEDRPPTNEASSTTKTSPEATG